MTPQELYDLIKQLGPGGQSRLARLLHRNPRTIRRWLKGERAIDMMTGDAIQRVHTEEVERMKLVAETEP